MPRRGRPKKAFPPPPKTLPDGRVRIWWNGTWHLLGRVDDEAAWRAEYARLIALWSTDPGAAPLRADEYLVSTLCRDYLASNDCPPEGAQRERVGTAIDLLLELFGHVAAASFGPASLDAWQSWLCGLPSKKDPQRTRFNRTSVRDLYWAVTRIWKWAAKTERLPVEKYTALLTIGPPRPEQVRARKIVEPADPAAVKAALPHLRLPVRAMVLLQWHSGARPEELCAMKVGEVLKSGKVHVPGAGLVDLDGAGVWARAPKEHKLASKGKSRILTFGPDAQQVLTPFLENRDPEEFVFRPIDALAELRAEQRAERSKRGGGSGGNKKKPASEPKRRAGERYSTRTYREAIERACAKAGVAHWFPYQLRHLAAAEIKAVFGVDGVMAVLGHHTQTMGNHYGGRAFKLAAEITRGRTSIVDPPLG